MRPPRHAKIDSSYIEPLSSFGWTVATCRAAIEQHERGVFRRSAILAGLMEREAEIAKAIKKRANALASRSALPFSVTPSSEGDGRKRKAVAERQGQLWWHTTPESVIQPIMRDTVKMGQALGYLTWSTGSEWVPRLNWLPMNGLAWEPWGIGAERRAGWVYTDGAGVRHEVTPGDGFWFLHEPTGPESFKDGAVRYLGLPWFLSDNIECDWARYDEKHGLPILEIDEPFWAQDDVDGEDGAEGTKADQYYAQFANLKSESVLRSPQGQDTAAGGWKSRWLEPKSQSWKSFEAHLDRLERKFRLGISGGDGSGAKGGDGETADERRHSEFLSTDAETLSTSLREQVWKPFAEYNYGDRNLAGWGRWDTRPPKDLSTRATTLKTVGEALAPLAAAGVDTDPVLEEMSLTKSTKPVPKPTEPPAQEQPAQ